ncbi:MAG: FKBP-type peptidyl-prolyl cis-trans isomerase [Nitrospirota bacterium]
MACVKEGDTIRIHFTGKLEDGTIFDSSDTFRITCSRLASFLLIIKMSFPAILSPFKKEQSNIFKSGHFYFGMTFQ